MTTRTPFDGLVIEVGHTADFEVASLAAAHELLDGVFDGELTDADWEHSLGGMHVMAWKGATIVGHAALIQRRVIHGGRALRAGCVEGVGVDAELRRRGAGGRMMSELERIIEHAYDIGVLGASDDGARFYARRGWIKWLGSSFALTPEGIVPTPEEDDCIFVYAAGPEIDVYGDITADWRDDGVW